MSETVDWKQLLEQTQPQPIKGELFRIIESQEQAATSQLVNRLDELELLNELIDGTKPAVPNSKKKPHYLVLTPFRYPPLKHGSRFGKKIEPSLFYGSLEIQTVLAEAAYYRFLFWSGMMVTPKQPFITQHSIFSVLYSIKAGVKLQNKPFSKHSKLLTAASTYKETQLLGSIMRNACIEGFQFTSARDTNNGVNVALFKPTAFEKNKPNELTSRQELICETGEGGVVFSLQNATETVSFTKDDVNFA